MKLGLVIILIAIFLRLIDLGSVPPGIANDELNISINAQSLLKTGTNIPGVVTGIVGKTLGDLSFGIHSELSSFLIVPFIALFGFNLISVKIPFVLASMGIVIVGYFITKKLLNEKVAIITMAILAVNPWLIFFGRSAYESILSSFFYFLSILLIINLSGWKKIYALLPLIAGFLCYFSAKTLVIPVAVVSSYASAILNKERNLKPLIALNVLIISFVTLYLSILPKTPAGSRINELKSYESSQNVNTKRTMGLESILTLPFENKITEELRIRITASLGEFNPNYLFFNGQPESIPSLSIPDHAFMYLIDFPLIILGLIFLAGKYKKQLTILLLLVFITLIPNFLNLQGTTYSIRTVILFPILGIISAIGIYSLENSLLRKIAVLVYIILILNFCFIYFSRLPVERSEAWFLSRRVLSTYISRVTLKSPDKKILLITEQPKLAFYKYLFYSGNYINPKEIALLNNKIAKKDYEIGNLKMTADCPENITVQKQNIIIESASSSCPKIQGDSIKSINDAGDVFTISDDILCQSLPKNQYPLIKSIDTLNIEKLTTEDFCKNYITDSR
jgi:hypothetical protein